MRLCAAVQQTMHNVHINAMHAVKACLLTAAMDPACTRMCHRTCVTFMPVHMRIEIQEESFRMSPIHTAATARVRAPQQGTR